MGNPTQQSGTFPTPGGWCAVTERGRQAAQLIAAAPAATLLATDFDGTLAAIVPDPSQARMDDRMRSHLNALGSRLGQIAVVTGRGVETVRELGGFNQLDGLGHLVILGQYGQEAWEAATGELSNPPAPQAVREALAALQKLVEEQTKLHPELEGVALEDKGRAIGVHTRRAKDPDAALRLLQEPVAEVTRAHELHLEPGRQVLELRSSTSSKGDALEGLVARTKPRIVVMIGDDLGDIPAFEYVRSLEQNLVTGICVVSGSAEQPAMAEQADVLCDGPAGVSAWFEDLVDAVNRPA